MTGMNMNFGEALRDLKAGVRVRREEWPVGTYLYLVEGSEFQVNRPPLLGMYPEGTWMTYHAHIDMFTAQGYAVPWVATQADLLEEDWEYLPEFSNAPNDRDKLAG